MNIINKLTLRYLKDNKKRTIFTILSIALSITMINAVGISLDTVLKYYTDTVVSSRGSFQYRFTSSDPVFFEMIENDEQIKDYYYTNTVGYKDVDNQRYISLKRGDSTFYNKRNVDDLLIKGQLPLKPNEIALGKDYIEELNIGDTISLENQETKKENIFTVVGFINEYDTTSSFDQSFSSISYVDLKNGEFYSISIEDKDLSANIFTHSKDIAQQYENQTNKQVNLYYNSAYLGSLNIFEEGSSSTFLIIYSLVSIILAIIIIASIFIIYQAFNLSTHDKIKYLGMLSSVGATPKQKRNSVFFEGVVLTLIAFPIGLICSYLGMYITFSYLNTLELINETGASFHTTVSIEFLFLTIILTLITLFLSLIKPAIHLSRISVIDALRKNDEIKVNKKKLRVGSLTRKFVSFDKQLAIKNYKRQGKRSRVIVFSLVLSMVLFVSIYSFSSTMYKEVLGDNMTYLYDLNTFIRDEQADIDDFINVLNNNDKVDSYYYYTRDYNSKAYVDINDVSKILDCYIIAVDDTTFKNICEENQIKYQGNNQALINDFIYIDESTEEIYNLGNEKNFLKKLKFEFYDNGESIMKEAPLFDSIDSIEKDTYRLFGKWNNVIEIIVPLSYYQSLDRNVSSSIDFCIKSKQYNELFDELTLEGYSVINVTQNNLSDIQSIQVFQIFIYGFICLMILFTLINIINMMSASIDKRQKEFAMLLSVGMSHRSIKKMIFEESLIYGLKTFIYAFPICVFIEYIIYYQIKTNDTIFSISYFAYIISFVVVMTVMYLTFKVGLRKFNKQNIVETLKDDI